MEGQSSIHFAAEENRLLPGFKSVFPVLVTPEVAAYSSPPRKLPVASFVNVNSSSGTDLVEPHEFINVPYCSGCMSGVCRFRRVESGPNARRILFMCTIREGQGSCGFKIWQDELEITIGAAHQSILLFQSTFLNCNGTGPASNNVVAGCELTDEEPNNESPLCDPLQYIQCLGTTSGT